MSRTESWSDQRGRGVYRRAVSPTVEFVHVDGEAVVYHCQTGSLHLLNAVATAIWSMFDAPASVSEAAERAASHFGVPPEDIHADVRDLTAQLLEIRLLEAAVGP